MAPAEGAEADQGGEQYQDHRRGRVGASRAGEPEPKHEADEEHRHGYEEGNQGGQEERQQPEGHEGGLAQALAGAGAPGTSGTVGSTGCRAVDMAAPGGASGAIEAE